MVSIRILRTKPAVMQGKAFLLLFHNKGSKKPKGINIIIFSTG
jgi:hypothetical protein